LGDWKKWNFLEGVRLIQGKKQELHHGPFKIKKSHSPFYDAEEAVGEKYLSREETEIDPRSRGAGQFRQRGQGLKRGGAISMPIQDSPWQSGIWPQQGSPISQRNFRWWSKGRHTKWKADHRGERV